MAWSRARPASTQTTIRSRVSGRSEKDRLLGGSTSNEVDDHARGGRRTPRRMNYRVPIIVFWVDSIHGQQEIVPPPRQSCPARRVRHELEPEEDTSRRLSTEAGVGEFELELAYAPAHLFGALGVWPRPGWPFRASWVMAVRLASRPLCCGSLPTRARGFFNSSSRSKERGVSAGGDQSHRPPGERGKHAEDGERDDGFKVQMLAKITAASHFDIDNFAITKAPKIASRPPRRASSCPSDR